MSDLRRVLHVFWSDHYRFPYKLNVAFAAYLLENAMLVLPRGGAFAHFSFLCPTVGFLEESLDPTLEHL